MRNNIFGVILLIFSVTTAEAQLNPIKRFDFHLLKDKVLYIPKYSESSDYAKRLIKKGKFDKLKDVNQRIEAYNTIWEEAMAESSYDATPYEIKEFSWNKLVKEKNKEAMVLSYNSDRYGNWYAQIMVITPKKRAIARTVINGLDLSSKEDIRLMINLLNHSLSTAAQLEEEGNKSIKAIKSKYKEYLVTFFERMKDMTFLVPKSEHKKPKKAEQRNADLADALKAWHISKYKLTSKKEVEEKRLEGDTDSYYWKNFNFYTKSPLITYRLNYILTAEKDEVVFYFMGTKRLKPSTLKEIQTKITKRAIRFGAKLN